MRVHRSARTNFFTVMGNEVLRDSRLSFCARGVLGYLISLPDGQRGDIRTLAEHTPEGRERVASALRELERLGYLKRAVRRSVEGKLYTEVDVFDSSERPSSHVVPDPGSPDSGDRDISSADDPRLKERDEESSLSPQPDEAEESGWEGEGDEDPEANAALLARIGRIEPRLALGWREAARLAPLVGEWRQRGASEAHLVGALTAGLPSCVYHPARFIETRLRSKMPAKPCAAPSRIECDECGVPVTESGLCCSCRTAGSEQARAVADSASVGARGAALVRAVLRGVSIESLMPALS